MTSKVDFLYLDEEDMKRVGVEDMSACIDAMEDVLKDLTKGDFVMAGENHNSHGSMVKFPESSPFPEMPLDTGDDRRFMAMPAYIGAPFDMAGCKWYGSNMANKEEGLPRSILMIMLNDKNTGAPKCLMSGNLVSAYRTGAIPGVGTRYMAKKDSRVCGICGPGVMGRTALASFVATCPALDTVKIKGRSKKGIDDFVSYVKEHYPQFTTITVCDTVEEMVRDTDVMSFASTSGEDPATYPFVDGSWVKPGAMIVAPSAVNFDSDFLAKRCRLVVDNIKLYDAWAEEYPYPTFGKVNIVGSKFTDMIHDGKLKREAISDMGAILLGQAPGRESDDDIIVYSVGGMPVEDVAWGSICYRKALEQGIGVKLKLWDSPTLA